MCRLELRTGLGRLLALTNVPCTFVIHGDVFDLVTTHDALSRMRAVDGREFPDVPGKPLRAVDNPVRQPYLYITEEDCADPGQ